MFEWMYPGVFCLLPLPLFVRFLFPAAKQTVSAQPALRVGFLHRVKALPVNTFSVRDPMVWLKSLIWVLLVLTLASPVWVGKPYPLPHQVRDIMLAIDISGSMQISDMQKNQQLISRLASVKEIAGDFIAKRNGDRLGLILFGSKAYLQTPLTFDTKTVDYMLKDASVGLAGMQTALGEAILQGVKRLKDQPEGNRVLILLTDGVNNVSTVAPLEGANLAKQYGVRIYTIGIGSDGNPFTVQTPMGFQQVSAPVDLDEKTLEKIATMTGGRYFRANDVASLQQVYADLNRLEPKDKLSRVFRPQSSLYPWFLGCALLLWGIFLFWQRRRGCIS